MTTRLRVRFDGKVLVPQEPVDLPVGETLKIEVVAPAPAEPDAAPLAKLADLARRFPSKEGSQTDRAAQHDQYLYGAPKRP